jgi:hypothetical protein
MGIMRYLVSGRGVTYVIQAQRTTRHPIAARHASINASVRLTQAK